MKRTKAKNVEIVHTHNLKNKGITLIALIITIIILLILAGITITQLTGNGLFNNTKNASEETKKSQATEIMNLKIANIQIDSYDENKEFASLQYIADKLRTDNDIQYVTLKNNTIFAKMKEYSYEFKINNSLELSISESIYNTVINNINNDDKLTEIFSDSNYVKEIVNDKDLMSEICENSILRNKLYDNYNVTEQYLSNSSVAIEAMKNSSRFEVVYGAGQYKNLYEDKAFVLGLSCATNSSGTYYIGEYLDTSLTTWNPQNYYSTDGLAYSINKFASSVYINGVYGVSMGWEPNMYAAIFKI